MAVECAFTAGICAAFRPAFGKSEWAQVEQSLVENAWYTAKLLSGEMPDGIEDVFAGLGLSLFPASARELSLDCSCPDYAVPCKHLAATFYLLAESFDDDPFAILAWRGREREDLLANLAAARTEGPPAADRAEQQPGRSTTAWTPITRGKLTARSRARPRHRRQGRRRCCSTSCPTPASPSADGPWLNCCDPPIRRLAAAVRKNSHECHAILAGLFSPCALSQASSHGLCQPGSPRTSVSVVAVPRSRPRSLRPAADRLAVVGRCARSPRCCPGGRIVGGHR